MLKNILFTFFIFTSTLFFNSVYSNVSIPVENIFSDITKEYKYINELQVLYDKGMISPNNEGEFLASSLLNRDEFVGILTEITCKKCIQPNTSLEIKEKFENTQLFFDINKDNKYFYCIASATTDGYVQGYQEGSICENGTTLEGERPFCASNTINLEEAIAVVLRASGIMTKEEAKIIENKILNGEITEALSDDIFPKNIDGSVYSFYPYFQKALEYEILDVDINGNTTISTLVEINDGKINPKKYISKEDFLQIAYLALKANSCNEKIEDSIALKINIYDSICTENSTNCKLSDLNNTKNIYDFGVETYSTCKLGINSPEGYIWRFYNTNSGEEIKKYGEYIDNYEFLSNGKWQVFLRVIDNCGNTGEVYSILNINTGADININNLSVSIEANPIFGKGPLLVDLLSIIEGGQGPYGYYWDFGNGDIGFGDKITYIYKQEGVYKITLTVKDSNGNISTATILIYVNGINNLNIDSDNDSIIDLNDACPLVKGDIKNSGCPILEKTCNSNTDCGDLYICSENNICLPKKVENICEYSGGDIISGNMICNSCPCDYFLDFSSTLRKCDIIFPAITSKDNTIIYGKGEIYQIK